MKAEAEPEVMQPLEGQPPLAASGRNRLCRRALKGSMALPTPCFRVFGLLTCENKFLLY